TPADFDVVEAVEAVADEVDATPAQVALAWLLEQDVVSAPIIGPKTSEQLADNVGALSLDLSAEQVERIAAPKTPTYSRS
ncbi:MAG: aldo/keto reductase, partial [Halobaculum sp.]